MDGWMDGWLQITTASHVNESFYAMESRDNTTFLFAVVSFINGPFQGIGTRKQSLIKKATDAARIFLIATWIGWPVL
jgi:hypothetical protein